MKKLFALSIFSAALAATGAFAQSTDKAPLPADKAPLPVLQRVIEAGGAIVASFPAGDGLTGWALRHPNGEHMVIYTTPGGKYFIAGRMFDGNGTNVTEGHLAAHVPAPDYTALLQDLRKATAIVAGPEEGHKGVVYVFTDPNCTYCAQAYKAFKPHTQAGLQVRYLPVAILGPGSVAKNETILSAADPLAALDTAEMAWPKGVVAAEKVSERTEAILRKNVELMGKFNLRGTPGIVYVKNGKPVTVGGMPKPEELANIVANAGK